MKQQRNSSSNVLHYLRRGTLEYDNIRNCKTEEKNHPKPPKNPAKTENLTSSQNRKTQKPHWIIKPKNRYYYSGFRKRKARVRKCNRIPRQKGGHGPRRFMRRLRKLGMRIRQHVLEMLWLFVIPLKLDARGAFTRAS